MPSTTPRPRDPRSLYFRGLPEGWEEDRALVTRTQRERMLDAMARAVAPKGYAKLTVSDVVALAGVSRRTFYEHFADKEECFLETYSAASSAVVASVAEAVRHSGQTDWHERVRVGLTSYTAVLAADPDLAHALLVDVLGAGPRAIEL